VGASIVFQDKFNGLAAETTGGHRVKRAVIPLWVQRREKPPINYFRIPICCTMPPLGAMQIE
jgi:hypothetical protein